ncbi:RecF/RecN/SMC amine-terminal domain protein [Toxoplasma gondii MAS]|uniref:RecF/RecN/SMC amine-terminal domain protein n=2 Tax=Toxoplasma gondii TaxID=5811 RepID=A0A086QK28_TOXGO|nr:RecF/RecN/SMC amine-terminal domain protein [Toxoplasma gondii MAS]RQX72308.1 RecF/RecN/SMC N terminal domain-containing protein [Toxoplasma gondii CAST]
MLVNHETRSVRLVTSDESQSANAQTKTLSGGEKSAVQLAFLIALAKQSVSPLHIFDEVDVFMDEGSRIKNLDLLLKFGLMSKPDKQIFLITPHSEICQFIRGEFSLRHACVSPSSPVFSPQFVPFFFGYLASCLPSLFQLLFSSVSSLRPSEASSSLDFLSLSFRVFFVLRLRSSSLCPVCLFLGRDELLRLFPFLQKHDVLSLVLSSSTTSFSPLITLFTSELPSVSLFSENYDAKDVCVQTVSKVAPT